MRPVPKPPSPEMKTEREIYKLEDLIAELKAQKPRGWLSEIRKYKRAKKEKEKQVARMRLERLKAAVDKMLKRDQWRKKRESEQDG